MKILAMFSESKTDTLKDGTSLSHSPPTFHRKIIINTTVQSHVLVEILEILPSAPHELGQNQSYICCGTRDRDPNEIGTVQ